MEFLVVFLPLALLVDVAWAVLYLRDRRLVRVLRRSHPSVLDSLRGRPRRWYDSDEILVQQRAIRRRLRRLLKPLLYEDPELAAACARVDDAERWMSRAAWLGAALTAAIVALLVARLSGGELVSWIVG